MRDPDELFIYRRYLPHWRVAGALYFVTWRLIPKIQDLTPDERNVVVAALRHFSGSRYRLLAYVVMNDHVHVLVEPYTHALQSIVHTWKSFTTKSLQRCGRHGRVWQPE